MINFHSSKGHYKLQLRAAYSGIRNEAAFRKAVENAITGYEARQPKVGEALRSKWEGGKEFEVLSYFGMLTWKEKVGG